MNIKNSEDYISKNPVVEGHFRVDCLDSNNNVIDTFEDHNMIMLQARRSMAEIFFNLANNKHAHKIVLGTLGHKDGMLFKAKTDEDGFVKERTHIFSEVPNSIYALGTLFEEIYKGDVIKVQNFKDVTKHAYYQYNGEYAKNFVVDNVTLGKYFTKLNNKPYTYTINFRLPGVDMKDNESCVLADVGSDASNDSVRVNIKDTSVIFTFYVDVNNGNQQEHDEDEYDDATSLFSEAGLYVNDRLFSMKTFGSKVKDESVKLRIIWTITF